jgi:general secretion pathway protein K
MNPRIPFPPRQRGAALLTAMLVVTVVATLASGMVWQQWRALQVEAAERAQTQSQWVLQGALDWTRMILREDAREGGADHLGEPWAAPLAEARLSTFLAADRAMAEDAPDAFLSGRIEDAQARYNLRNLIQQGKVSPAELQTLERLCGFLGLNGDIAPRLADALRRATPGSGNEAPTEPGTGSVPTTPLMPVSIDDLVWLGLDDATVRRLQPYVVLLPRETPVNLNTPPRK